MISLQMNPQENGPLMAGMIQLQNIEISKQPINRRHGPSKECDLVHGPSTWDFIRRVCFGLLKWNESRDVQSV